jgi:hypothetical protein
MRLLLMCIISLCCLFTFGCQKGFSETFTPVGKLSAEVPKDRFRYVSKDYGYLLRMLEEKKFAELNKELAQIQEAPKQDISAETAIDLSLQPITQANSDLEPLLTAWVTSTPNAYQPYLARGIYYYSMAACSRGAATADKTSEAQLSGMDHYLGLARSDLERSLNLKEDLLQAYCALLNICRASRKDDLESKQLITKALKHHPGSLNVRMAYLGTLMPRWGGSFKAMDAFVKESRPYYKINPRLMLLEGRVDFERGDELLVFNNDWEGALKLFNQALRYGDYWFYLQQRSVALVWLNRNEEAYADCNVALAMNPNAKEALENRALCTSRKPELSPKGLTSSLDDLDRVIALFPKHEDNLQHRAGVRYLRKEFDLAIVDCDRILQLNPANKKAVKLKEMSLTALQQGK